MFIKSEFVVSNDIGEALCRTVTLYCNMSLKVLSHGSHTL